MLSDFIRSLTAHSGSPSATLGWLYLLLVFSDWLLSPTVGENKSSFLVGWLLICTMWVYDHSGCLSYLYICISELLMNSGLYCFWIFHSKRRGAKVCLVSGLCLSLAVCILVSVICGSFHSAEWGQRPCFLQSLGFTFWPFSARDWSLLHAFFLNTILAQMLQSL